MLLLRKELFMFCTNCGIENEATSGPCRACGFELSNKTGGVEGKTMESAEKETQTREPGERSSAIENSSVLYAGFWKRAAAASIDSFLLFVVGTGLGLLYLMLKGSDEGLEVASNISGILFGWLYFSYMESSEAQATLGKRALGIIVTDINGKRVSFYRATGRHFGKIVSSITLGIGFIMAGFTKKKQALHDKMFDCLVVMKK
ncbi:MAG: RDD family protein [Thermodesulfobacteriota bacterium]